MMVLFYLHLCFLLSYVGCYQVTNQLDFERDCNVQMMVADSSIIEVFAYPQANVIPETSSCVAKFQATPSDRKIRIYVDEFFLGPGACGHKMNIYDGDPFLTEPTWSLGCNSERGTYTSTTGMVILSFEKPSVDTSQKYKFNFKLTTDRDDSNSKLLFETQKLPAYRILLHRKRRENIPSYTAPLTGSAAGSGGGGLTSGAIAGIAVGGVVGAVIIIAICIFLLWKFMRQAEEKKRYGAAEPPPVFVTSSSSTVNGILKHPGSAGSVRSKSTNKSRGGFDNDAFSDTSETKNSRYNEKPVGDYRYDEEMGRGSYSRRGRDRSRYDQGHQNPSFMDDDADPDRREGRGFRSRESYKQANGEPQHISLADLSSSDRQLAGRGRRYGDESSSFPDTTTDTNRTYSDSSRDSRDDSVSFNPGGKRYKKSDRQGSIRRSRARSTSMTSSQSGRTKQSHQRSSSADRADQASQQGSQHGSQHGSHSKQHHNNHHHHHHRGSSRSSRRNKQKPTNVNLPIFAEVKNMKKKHSNPPLSNCGIAPGSSRRSFKTQSHVAFSDVSKKSETSSNSASKSKSSKSYDNHGYAHDGTSVASSNVTKNEVGVNRGDKTRHSLNEKDSNQTDLVRNRNGRSSYRGDKNGGKINYPDVVDSARKSEKVNARLPSVEARSRSDSMKRSEKDSSKNRSNSLKRESHKDQVERDTERDKQRYEDKNKNQNSRHNNRNHRNKSESVFTDDSNISSVSDKRNDRRYQQTDRYEDKRYRDDQRSSRRTRDDRGYRDDRHDHQRHRNDRFDDRRHYDDRYDYRDNTTRDTRPKERSSSQRRTRNSQRRYSDSDDEFDGRRQRRDERGKQRSNSTSRLRSSHRDSPSDFDRNRDNCRDGRGRYESERDQGLRRQDSSRSQSGRHRSRSSYR